MAYRKTLYCITNINMIGYYSYTSLSSSKKGAKKRFFESPTGASDWEMAKKMGYRCKKIDIIFDV